MEEQKTTITVQSKDKIKFKQYCAKHDIKQYKFFKVMLKVLKDFAPELNDLVKMEKKRK